ncbi:uncharacterized protein LOC111058338 [Nilaparvata lugens]|uniref:uncharacterized protein LOC111058338 n=1 Tax=Nilaparvata lugens TaxID=108931 RepID=UPI00193CD45E|nr:uncharacterized protein LOC111058338 [Nilaparvata lugens]XP_039279896.1 uncharacterized protein LOC111058338 [Nilaparvata lugens]
MVSPETAAAELSSNHAPVKEIVTSQVVNGGLSSLNAVNNGEVTECPVQIKVTRDQDVKQPSYVSLARCISGYTLLTTYDSKQREGFRSRDISPARVPVLLNAGSPSNGQVTGGRLPLPLPLPLSPLSPSSADAKLAPNCTSPIKNMDSKNYTRISSTSTDFTTITSTSTCSSSSVLQRVERIFGPGALAQGFYARNRTRNLIQAREEPKESNNNVSVSNSSEESLPVLKLLRPEFRAQLSVARHRYSNNRNSSKDEPDAQVAAPKEYKIPITIEADAPKLETKNGRTQPAEKNGRIELEEKDGRYFLKVVHDAMAALERLASEVETELASNPVAEELEGRLRSAIGKARLLNAQKLRQFEGLCHKNISQDPNDDFKTTDEDLAGFWDMVTIQVDSMHKEFDSIKKLKANGWKMIEESPSKKSSEPIVSKTGPRKQQQPTNSIANGKDSKTNNCNGTSNGAGAGNSKAKDEARRKMLQERRLAMKKSMNAAANQDQVFAAANNNSC